MVGTEMPPRSSLSSFSVSDANHEVVCPLMNPDGSACRKRCVGEKRYRSMQEHIRRAHPERYISKLPATEESFVLMINTPPSERPLIHVDLPHNNYPVYPHDQYLPEMSHPKTSRHADEYHMVSIPAVSAAAALAQLQGHKFEHDWDPEGPEMLSNFDRRIPRSSIELPPILPICDQSPLNPNRPRETLPSLLAGSSPGRSSTLPPLHRPLKINRPRKLSVSKRGQQPYHKKQKSKGSTTDMYRHLQDEDRLRPGGHDRKALSAEPSPNYGKRWEDLIDAADQAASATGDIDDDRTPVPQSPISIQRESLPPVSQPRYHAQPGSYQASPLQQTLTPPSYNQPGPQPFPSVESGENFHMESRGLSDSSPIYSSRSIHIYCAACQGVSLLKDSFACTECICGLCKACVEVLLTEQGARRRCPRCSTIGGRFKPFQLDIR